jgi:hypothetical protein
MKHYILVGLCVIFLTWAWFYIAKPVKKQSDSIRGVIQKVDDWNEWVDSITNLEVINGK